MTIVGAVAFILASSTKAEVLTPIEAKAVNAYISREAARRARGGEAVEEFVGARRIGRGDVDGDGRDDLVVLYTLERGNDWTQFVAVFGGPRGRPLASTRVCGKGQRSVDLGGVTDRRIELATKRYGPSDALCCPSVAGHAWLSLRAGALEEVESVVGK
jgi:hypothetical protein